MPKAVLVFDKYELPQDLQDSLHELGAEVCHGNGGYVPWEVGGLYDDNTLGYLSDEVAMRFEAFFAKAQVVKGTHVLIYNWW